MARMIINYAPQMENDIHTLQFMGKSYTLHFRRIDNYRAESIEQSFHIQVGMDFYKFPEPVQAALIEVSTAETTEERRRALQVLSDYERSKRDAL